MKYTGAKEIVAFIAGDRHQAKAAANERGIPSVYSSEGFGCTRVRIPLTYEAKVEAWRNEGALGIGRCTGWAVDEITVPDSTS